MVWKKKLNLILTLCLLSTTFSMSADDGILSLKEWEDKKKEIEYSKKPRVEEVKKENQEEKSFEIPPIETAPGWIKSPTVKWIAATVFILLLVLTLYYILRNVQFSKEQKISSDIISFAIDNAEKDLEKAELDQLLEQCIAQKEFRSAVRILYLKTIQNLHLSGKIQWKKEKTNRNFLNEMRNDKAYPMFRQLTWSYETVWYGDHAIEEVHFRKIEKIYHSIDPKVKA